MFDFIAYLSKLNIATAGKCYIPKAFQARIHYYKGNILFGYTLTYHLGRWQDGSRL